MSLVFSVSWEAVNFSANKNQHWVLSLNLRQWDFKKLTLTGETICVCVCVFVCSRVYAHAWTARPLSLASGTVPLTLLFFLSWQDDKNRIRKIKDLPFILHQSRKMFKMHSGVCRVYKSVSSWARAPVGSIAWYTHSGTQCRENILHTYKPRYTITHTHRHW